MTIIEDFRAELIRILDAADKKMPDAKVIDSSIWFNFGGKCLCIPKTLGESFLRAIRLLRMKSSNNVSDAALVHILQEFLIELKYDPDQNKVKNEIDRHIGRLFERLKGMRAKQFLFLVPIMNLQVTEEISIGDSSFFNLDEKSLGIVEERFSLKFRHVEESLANAINDFVKFNETKTVALVIVQAPDTKKATELALEKAESCLNVLRLYGLNAPFVIRDDYKKIVMRYLPFVSLEDKYYLRESKSINEISSFCFLDSKKILELDKGGFHALNRLLSKKTDELTRLQEDLLIAVMWLGNAVKDNQRNMKFVKAIVALETLLVPDGGQSKCDVIAKRFASIACPSATDSEKKEVFLNVRSLYQTRNSIIHAGEFSVLEEDLSQIMNWTTALIQILLPYAEKYPTLQELINAEFPVNDLLYRDC